MELVQLKTAWAGGIIDKDTFLWMEDMDEWAPIHMIYGMEPAIATWEGLYFLVLHVLLSILFYDNQKIWFQTSNLSF